MRRTYLVILLVVGLALMSGALVLAEDTTHPPTVAAQGPGADGQALLDYILNESPYTEWGTWPADRWSDFGGVLQSAAPHGESVRVFVNDVAREAASADDFDGTLPPGSIIVKENYPSGPDMPGDVAALTVMSKVEGFNPDAGDWFWLKASPDGMSIDAEGAVEGCIGCHSQDGNADYMLRYAFGDEPAATFGDPLPEADGAAILDYVLNTNPYTEWGSYPDTEMDDFPGPVESGAPHGNVVRIFANDRFLDALERGDDHVPHGAIIVKENWTGTMDAPGDLAALTIQYRAFDYDNPDSNDWYWIKSSGDGMSIDAEGAVEGCINCHGQQDDFLLRFDWPEMMDDDMMGDDDDMGGDDDTSMDIDANAVIDRACTVCHTRDRIDQAVKDAAGWTETIDRMIGYGAQVSDEERQALIDFLAQ